MPRYMIFEKTRNYDYKFKGSKEASNGNKAIQLLRSGNPRSISNKGIYIYEVSVKPNY